MAAMATVEELLAHGGDGWDITIVGAEPDPPYNRVLLSQLLTGAVGTASSICRSAGGTRRGA